MIFDVGSQGKGRLKLITKFLIIVFLIVVIVVIYQYIPSIFSPVVSETELESFADGLLYYKYGIDLDVSTILLHTNKVLKVTTPFIYARESTVCYDAPEGSQIFSTAGEEIKSEFGNGKICWSMAEKEVVLKSTTPLSVEELASSYVSGNEVKIKLTNINVYPLILNVFVDLEDKFGYNTFSVYKNQLYLSSATKTFSDNFVVPPYSQTEYSFKIES